MRKRWRVFLIVSVGLGVILLKLTNTHAKGELAAAENIREVSGSGWSILNDHYLQAHLFDGFAFEWQYFMVHDAARQFTGSIGYVLVDPRGHLGHVGAQLPGESAKPRVSIMPSGTSLAVAGRWADGSTFSNYERFKDHYQVGRDDKNFSAEDSQGDHFARLEELEKISAQAGRLRLAGRTDDIEYDLLVTPDWTEFNTDSWGQPFGPLTGSDMGYLPGEHWSVQMQWPRTHVEGSMTNRKTGETYPISGHGYRENSWGRWNFAFDGWAFSILSDPKAHVQWAWQTYHKSKDMDWLDLAFFDQGQAKTLRFFAKEHQLRWKLKDWSFHKEARQCIPNAVEVVAQDENYRVQASYDLKDSQRPMLSSATALTKVFVIMIHMPYIRGTIQNVRTGEVIAEFEGQGGGEFSTLRSVWNAVSPSDCENWGQRFNREYAPSPLLP